MSLSGMFSAIRNSSRACCCIHTDILALHSTFTSTIYSPRAAQFNIRPRGVGKSNELNAVQLVLLHVSLKSINESLLFSTPSHEQQNSSNEIKNEDNEYTTSGENRD